MEFLFTVNYIDFFYALMAVFVTVILIILARAFGNLPVSSPGLDFNLLTYGFLWDTTFRAVRGVEYWSRFDPNTWPLNKPTTLLTVALVNLILLAWNMKLAHKIEQYATNSNTKRFYVEWILRPFSLAIGITSLVAFLFMNTAWT